MKHSIFRLFAAILFGTAATAYGQTVVYEQHFNTESEFNTMTAVDADNYKGSYSGFWKYNSYGTKAAYI